MINNNQVTIHHENRLWFKLYILKTNGRSKAFSEPRRARTRSETISVFVFIIHIDIKHNTYTFYILKTRKKNMLSPHWC